MVGEAGGRSKLVHEYVGTALVDAALGHLLAGGVVVAEPLVRVSLAVGDVVPAAEYSAVGEGGDVATLNTDRNIVTKY